MSELLFIAYHFPPLQGSSGIQRTLAFARNLPQFGWQPHILTAHTRAYDTVSFESENLIPEGTPVHRAAAFDSQRHFSIGGRYLDILAVPDRWQSWIPPAIIKGVGLVRRHKLKIVYSTYPIASAHVIGFGVSRLSGVPWIADLRDPMLQAGFPSGRLRRRSFDWIERIIFKYAAKVIVTTPGSADFYRQRYPELAADKIVVIANGYDDAISEQARTPYKVLSERPLTLLHSGVLYGEDRDPSNFFQAVRELRNEAGASFAATQIVLRAPGTEVDLSALASRYGVADLVDVRPAIPYREALAEMMQADALLVFQADTCNHQIPAKVYEYIFARRPILGITDPVGDTGRLLASVGINTVARLEEKEAVKAMLKSALSELRTGSLKLPDETAIANLSRKARTREFASILDAVVFERS